jgi:hypothetical protein
MVPAHSHSVCVCVCVCVLVCMQSALQCMLATAVWLLVLLKLPNTPVNACFTER